ncbi:MAG: fibronectin type III domain-containing protein [Chloroflexi bacterium]|nr:fibronectin type III domain-containing protein [Chloroflexota bacterium]
MIHRFFLFAILIILATTGCATESTGVRAWIDSPMDGTAVQAGAPINVLSHVYAPDGVADVLFSVNGIAYRRNPPTVPGVLAKASHEWFPDKPGDYTLQIIAYAKNGQASAPARARIHVIGKTTFTPTPTLVRPISVTPTMVPLSDLQIISVEPIVAFVKGDQSFCDIRVVYRNAGIIPVPNDYVIQAFLDGRPHASITRGRGFGVGGTSEATFVYQFTGTAYIGINLDSTSAVNEISETNNAFAEARMCGTPTAPISVTPSPSIGLPGITPSRMPTRTPTPPPPVVPPASISFRADQTTLTRGQCTTLRWDVENATAVFLDNNGVAGHSTSQVCPSNSTTYTLRVVAPAGDATRTVTINVQVPANTPTVTPTPRDTQGPSAPTLVSPKGSLSCRTSVTLDWNAVSDPSGIKNYIVKWKRNDGQTGGTVTTSTQTNVSVSCGKSYTWSVQAVDNANNPGSTSSASFSIQEGLY